MWKIVLILVLCYHALSQPVANEPSIRHTRQLTECCPCPSPSNGGQDMLVDRGQLTNAHSLDDCPCRDRDADSEGASTNLFPAAVHNDRPLVSANGSKGDTKNLLEPEVALATSMLDTLREATDAEYQEALARDAARSAMEPNDAVPEESASNVVIIVNPRDSENDDDFVSEASHTHESRCIHPIGSTSLGRMRASSKPVKLLPDSLSLPKLTRPGILHRNSLDIDSDVGASNANENIVDANTRTLKFPLRDLPPIKSNSALGSVLKSFSDSRDSNILKKTESILGLSNETAIPKSNLLDTLKLKIDRSLRKTHDDLNSDPSDLQEIPEEKGDKTSKIFRNDKGPVTLRNLLKLKDVELIPKTIRKNPLNMAPLDAERVVARSYLKAVENCVDNANIISEDINTEEVVTIPSIKETTKPSSLSSLIIKIEGREVDSEGELITEEQADQDALPSPSQTKFSVIESDSEMVTDAIESDKTSTEKSDGCNSLHSEVLTTTSHDNLAKDQSIEDAKVVDYDLPDVSDITEEATDSVDENQETNESQQNIEDDIGTDSESGGSTIEAEIIPFETPKGQNTDSLDKKSNEESLHSPCDQEVNNSRSTEVEVKTIISNKKIVPGIKPIPSLRETLSSLREDVIRRYENLKKASEVPKSFKISNNNNEQRFSNENINKIITDPTQVTTVAPINLDSEASASKVSFNDLQKMSDKLLDLTSNKEDTNIAAKAVQCEENLSIDTYKSNKSDKETDNIKNPSELVKSLDGENIGSVEQEACPSKIQPISLQNNNNKLLTTDHASSEDMTVEASNSNINILPGLRDPFNTKVSLQAPFLQDLIVQPPKDPLSLFRKPLGDVLNLNPNLPTLDDLRERLSNIFNPNDRSVEDDSIESDFTNESPVATMTGAASTINSQRKTPSLKQLQDFDFEVFSPKPLSSLGKADILSKSPRLNLNSYRAKLPVPSNLDLKQIKLESNLGKKPAVFRTSTKNISLRRDKPHNLNLLGNPLSNLPTLDELRDTLQSNTKDLFSNSLQPDLNLFGENLRSNSIGDVTENMRLNAEKTMKVLQRRMKSPLRTNTNIGDPFAKPQELLDDVSDKLKAIHYDFNDRLENIVDQARLDKLNLASRATNRNSNKNVMTNFIKNKVGSRPARLQTSASTIETQEFESPDVPQARSNLNKPHRTLTPSASTLTSTKVELPKAKPLPYLRIPPFGQNIARTAPILNHREPELTLPRYSNRLEDFKTSTLKKPLSAFHDLNHGSKITISFGSTTAKPLSSSNSDLRPRFFTIPSSQINVNKPIKPTWTNSETVQDRAPEWTNKFNSNGNFKLAPSELNHYRSSAALDFNDGESQVNNLSMKKQPNANSKLKSLLHSDLNDQKRFDVHNRFNKATSVSVFDKNKKEDDNEKFSKSEPLVWSDVTKNAFLSKVRDVANTRISTPEPKYNENVKSQFKADMSRSASENTDIVFEEPLKENVTYKCRMVCTKESR